MIEGRVHASLDAVMTLAVQGPTRGPLQVPAVIDTGFDRFLTLRPSTIDDLGLAFVGVNAVTMADGSEVLLKVYGVTLHWDGKTRDVVAYATEAMPLVGMAMLHGHSLYIEVRDGGQVVIRADA